MNWRSISSSTEKARVRRMEMVNGMDPRADESLSSTFSRIFSICLLRYVHCQLLTSYKYINILNSNLNNISSIKSSRELFY